MRQARTIAAAIRVDLALSPAARVIASMSTAARAAVPRPILMNDAMRSFFLRVGSPAQHDCPDAPRRSVRSRACNRGAVRLQAACKDVRRTSGHERTRGDEAARSPADTLRVGVG